MSRSTLFVILFLAVIAALLGWNYVQRPFQAAQDVAETVTDLTPTPVVDSQQQQLDQLSPAEKIAALMAVPLVINANASGAAQPVHQDWIAQHRPGTVVLFGSQVSQSAATQAVATVKQFYQGSLPIIAVDHEGGTVQRLSGAGFTKLPSWQALCATTTENSQEQLTTSATELKAVGVTMVFAPVVDVASQSPILRTRVCSADPAVVAEQAINFIQVFQTQGIAPVLKHYPGIGAVRRDLHTTFDRVTITPEDALLYKFILDRFPSLAVMTTPVGVTNQYPDVPCNLSLDCVKELTSNYPQTLVITDSLEMVATRFNPDSEAPLTLDEISFRALKAGNQVLLYGQAVTPDQLTEIVDRLVTEYDQDPSFKDQVDQAVLRVWQASAVQGDS